MGDYEISKTCSFTLLLLRTIGLGMRLLITYPSFVPRLYHSHFPQLPVENESRLGSNSCSSVQSTVQTPSFVASRNLVFTGTQAVHRCGRR